VLNEVGAGVGWRIARTIHFYTVSFRQRHDNRELNRGRWDHELKKYGTPLPTKTRGELHSHAHKLFYTAIIGIEMFVMYLL